MVKLFSLRWAAFLGTAHAVVPTVEIAPGVDMPQVNLGTCCGSEATDAFPVWFSAGGRGVDTALDYGKEVPGGTQAELGAALVKSGVARDEVFITTKIRAGFDVSHGGPACLFQSSDHALSQVEQDLKELNVSQVDLVLLHAPCWSAAANLKLWQGLEQALEQNLTRAIGVSNYDKNDLAALLAGATVKPAVNQCQLSISHHADEDIAYAASQGIVYEAYEAMRGCPFTDARTQAIAASHKTGVSNVCLRYVLQKGSRMALAVGLGSNATKMPSYAAGNLDLFAFELAADEMTYLDALADNATAPQ